MQTQWLDVMPWSQIRLLDYLVLDSERHVAIVAKFPIYRPSNEKLPKNFQGLEKTEAYRRGQHLWHLVLGGNICPVFY